MWDTGRVRKRQTLVVGETQLINEEEMAVSLRNLSVDWLCCANEIPGTLLECLSQGAYIFRSSTQVLYSFSHVLAVLAQYVLYAGKCVMGLLYDSVEVGEVLHKRLAYPIQQIVCFRYSVVDIRWDRFG